MNKVLFCSNMHSIKNLEYEQCRVCYDSTSNLQLLTSFADFSPQVADKTYAQILLEVCNINILDDKPLGRWPQFVCFQCSCKLKLAYDFIQHTLKINKLLHSIADLLQIRSGSDFIEKPALDIPLEIKGEKDDDFDSPSNERKFQYSPNELDVTKVVSILEANEVYNDNFPNNNKINDNEFIREIFIPSTIEFVSNDIIIKDDLEKFHRKIIDNISNADQDDDIDLVAFDDSLLRVTETKTSNTSMDENYNKPLPRKSKLNRHERLSHESRDSTTHCSICSQNFARPYNYKRHVKTVHKSKTFKQRQTKRKPTIKKIVQNINLDDLICNICEKAFRLHRQLQRHKRYTHISEEEKITCNLCGHKFARPDNYQSHLRRAHKINNVSPTTSTMDNSIPRFYKYYCSKCDRSYSRSTLLFKHERDVHGGK